MWLVLNRYFKDTSTSCFTLAFAFSFAKSTVKHHGELVSLVLVLVSSRALARHGVRHVLATSFQIQPASSSPEPQNLGKLEYYRSLTNCQNHGSIFPVQKKNMVVQADLMVLVGI